jgi:hypothetical protein
MLNVNHASRPLIHTTGVSRGVAAIVLQRRLPLAAPRKIGETPANHNPEISVSEQVSFIGCLKSQGELPFC